MNKYIWCEDSSAGYFFWKKLFSVIHSNYQVESKGNNTELRKAISKIGDDDNVYYIFIDSMYDNSDVLREVTAVKRLSADKKNVVVVEIYSFEFVLLSFASLESWIFADNDELKKKRDDLLELKDEFLRFMLMDGNADSQEAFSSKLDEMGYNNEQLASKLLFKITRNTGFETNKGQLGYCFYGDCCEWNSRQENDICGLDKLRLSYIEKMIQLKEQTVANAIFQEVGL